MFLGNWERVVFIHYEADPEALQRQVPFELDLWHGRAIVSVVAFSMRRLRPAFGGKFTERLLMPMAHHEFCNVRAYVRSAGLPGIYFMAEWVNNPLSRLLGPAVYGLPYRFGRIAYQHQHERGCLSGRVTDSFSCAGKLPPGAEFRVCRPASRDEFLLERYSAFTRHRGIDRFFHIWHTPWLQTAIDMEEWRGQLLHKTGAWFDSARLIGANYSPSAVDIWMGVTAANPLRAGRFPDVRPDSL